MPDPNITHAAIQSHAATLQGGIGQNLANAARCKCWSGAIVGVLLFLSAGRVQLAALAWASAVVVLLAFADACCTALARELTAAYNRFMAKVPLNGGNLPKAEDWLGLPETVLGLRDVGRVLGALLSFSVWPFYGALLALVITFYVQASPAANGASSPLPVKVGPVASGMPQAGAKPSQPALKPLPPATNPHPNTRVIPQPANPQPRALPQPPSTATRPPGPPPNSTTPATNLPNTVRPVMPNAPGASQPATSQPPVNPPVAPAIPPATGNPPGNPSAPKAPAPPSSAGQPNP